MNFAGHSLLGLFGGAIAAIGVAAISPHTLSTLSVPLLVPATVLVLVYAGAVYPDIDLHNSIPRRRVLPYLQAGVVGAVAATSFYVWDVYVTIGASLFALLDVSTGSVVAGGAGVLALGIGAVLAVEPLVGVVTGAHRTWTHSIGIHAAGAGTLSIALWLLAPVDADDRLILALLPFAFVIGVAVHHLADDLG